MYIKNNEQNDRCYLFNLCLPKFQFLNEIINIFIKFNLLQSILV